MIIRYEGRFRRMQARIPDQSMRRRVDRAIENVEVASSISEVPGNKRLNLRGNFYRIRIGDYRIVLRVDRNVAILLRVGHRRNVYRNLP